MYFLKIISDKEGFNSMIVRLKVDQSRIDFFTLLSFNSMIVRLKAGIARVSETSKLVVSIL